jgi:GntR family transcriptional regulator, vanillate catabolism transcriptional regulator
MKQAGIRAHAVEKPKPLQDSASQIARATQGLREMLLRGVFHPGVRIAEIPLSIKLGVSRTPLRLAFEKLVHEGLIKALPHSGFAANEFSVDDIWEAIETRGILEGAAARLAAERLKSPAELEPLRKICRAVEDALTLDVEIFTDQYLDLNEAFHAAILDLAKNEVLRRTADQVCRLPFASPSALILLYKNVPESRGLIPIAQEHHRALIDAIELREGARAEGLAREHARIMRRNLELAMANRNVLDTIPGGRLIGFRKSDETQSSK